MILAHFGRVRLIKDGDDFVVIDEGDFTLNDDHVYYAGTDEFTARDSFIACCQTDLDHAVEEGRLEGN